MSAYRTAPDSSEQPVSSGESRKKRVVLLIAASGVGHAALLAVMAFSAPPPPPQPRRVEVMRFEAVPMSGGAAIEWRSEGGRRPALIGADPAASTR